eukprot:Hpha_TRINITY_DN8921_c0_g1::TRINITY_DN8921_c0_g1_i1::g.80855::m.80855
MLAEGSVWVAVAERIVTVCVTVRLAVGAGVIDLVRTRENVKEGDAVIDGSETDEVADGSVKLKDSVLLSVSGGVTVPVISRVAVTLGESVPDSVIVSESVLVKVEVVLGVLLIDVVGRDTDSDTVSDIDSDTVSVEEGDTEGRLTEEVAEGSVKVDDLVADGSVHVADRVLVLVPVPVGRLNVPTPVAVRDSLPDAVGNEALEVSDAVLVLDSDTILDADGNVNDTVPVSAPVAVSVLE